ncbi:MAG: glycosyltransferase family 2 protein [Solirubrobacteraceae bacterium]|nr:glycosyltransferase family 2 protein [Solirubrobacteraceae bacterium]
MTAVGAIVLTGGRRPDDLRLAVDSLRRQRGVDVDVVVVGNGCAPGGLPDGVRVVSLPEDVGIPGGRNAGVGHVHGDLLFFLDDDAALRDDDALAAVAAKFAADPRLGAVQLRVEPRDGGPRLRNWTPRLRVGDPARSSDVAALWEGAVAVRRSVFAAVGGWPAEFRYVHEGVDLAWRVLDAGYRVHYAGDVVALHPSHAVGRHGYSAYHGARNRVWLARRHLPVALGVPFVATFAARSLPMLLRRRHVRDALRGYRDGLRGDCGPRRPLRAATLWRMTRTGRPPVI